MSLTADTFLDGAPIGRMVSILNPDSEAPEVTVECFAEFEVPVRQTLERGIRVEIQQPVTRSGSPAGPPRYLLRSQA